MSHRTFDQMLKCRKNNIPTTSLPRVISSGGLFHIVQLFLNVLLYYSEARCPIAVSTGPYDAMVLFFVPIVSVGAMSLISRNSAYGAEGKVLTMTNNNGSFMGDREV